MRLLSRSSTAHDWALDAAATADALTDQIQRGVVCARRDGDFLTERKLRGALMQARLLRRQLLDDDRPGGDAA